MKTKNEKPTVTKPPFTITTTAGDFVLEVFPAHRVRLSRPGTALFLGLGVRSHAGWHMQRIVRDHAAAKKVASVEEIIAGFVAWKEAHPRIFSMLEKLAERDRK